MTTFTFDSTHRTLVASASALNGTTVQGFVPGDDIQITDQSLNSSNIQLSINGNVLSYSDANGHTDSITVENLGPGRFVTRDIPGGGVDIRLEQNAHNDFSGDGFSDILWRNDNGTVTDWLGQANGSFVGNGANFSTSVPSNWHIAGTGDFNGDGRVDILWQADNGTVSDWLGQANGSFVGNGANFSTTVPSNWHIVGTGDFNDDGRTDILWQADNGTVSDWLGQANGGFVGNGANFSTNVPSSWHVIGTGDFNGDGYDDILWRNDNGTVTDWLGQANGSFVGNGANFSSNVSSDWHIVGTGDFNGDGITDILWRNDNGTVTDWLGQANGTFRGNQSDFSSSDWHIVGTGDYNKDGIDDILWRNDNGTVTEWLGQTNGLFISNGANVSAPTPTDWHVQDPAIHSSLF